MGFLSRFFTSKASPATSTYNANNVHRRFGQTIEDSKIEAACRRLSLLNIIAVVLPKLAIGDGFELQKDNKAVFFQQELQNSNLMNELLILRQYVSMFGSAGFILFLNDNKDGLAFKPEAISFEIDDNADMTVVQCTEKIGGNHQDFVHTPDLRDYFHVVLERSDKKYEGIPEIEKGWDIAYAFNNVLEAAMVLCNRVGYGLKIATILSQGDETKDSARATTYKNALEQLESGDTNIILYHGVDEQGNTWKDELTVDSGNGNFNYQEKGNMLLEAFAGLYGIPKNWLVGVFQGQTVGANAVIQLLYGKLKEIQDQWEPTVRNILKRWCELHNFQWSDEYKIVWNLKPGLDKNKTDAIKALVDANILSAQEAREELGYQGEPPEPQTIKIEAIQQEQDEAINEQFGQRAESESSEFARTGF